MQQYIIGDNEAGQRFDKYLKKILKEAPDSFIYNMLRKKNIVLNGKKSTGTEKLEKQDVVKIFLADDTVELIKEELILKAFCPGGIFRIVLVFEVFPGGAGNDIVHAEYIHDIRNAVSDNADIPDLRIHGTPNSENITEVGAADADAKDMIGNALEGIVHKVQILHTGSLDHNIFALDDGHQIQRAGCSICNPLEFSNVLRCILLSEFGQNEAGDHVDGGTTVFDDSCHLTMFSYPNKDKRQVCDGDALFENCGVQLGESTLDALFGLGDHAVTDGILKAKNHRLQVRILLGNDFDGDLGVGCGHVEQSANGVLQGLLIRLLGKRGHDLGGSVVDSTVIHNDNPFLIQSVFFSYIQLIQNSFFF